MTVDDQSQLTFDEMSSPLMQVLRDLKEDFGFETGPWNQAYQFDTLPTRSSPLSLFLSPFLPTPPLPRTLSAHVRVPERSRRERASERLSERERHTLNETRLRDGAVEPGVTSSHPPHPAPPASLSLPLLGVEGWGFRFKVQGSGFRVQGWVMRFEGWGWRVWGGEFGFEG